MILAQLSYAQTDLFAVRNDEQSISSNDAASSDDNSPKGYHNRKDRFRAGRENGEMPPDGARRGGARPPKKLTSEEQAELFTVLEQINPEIIEKIKKWQDVNPQHSNRILTRLYGRFRGLIELKKYDKNSDKKSYDLKVRDVKLDAQNHLLANEYRNNPNEKTKQALLKTISEQLDIRQKLRKREIAKLKEKINKLEANLEKDKANRDRILNRKFDDITRSKKRKSKNKI